MTPLVTIGISFLNPGSYFKDAIRSVFAQTLQDWELILVDDGSADGSLNVARSVRSGRVKVYSDSQQKGLPTRLNQIAEIAQGEFLVRMDADDLMHPRRVEKQIEFIMNNEVDAVGTGAWMIDEEDKICGQSFRSDIYCRKQDILTTLKWGWPIHATLVALRRWALQNPYDPHYPRAEDRELFVRVLGKSRIDEIRENLYFYRRPDRLGVQAYLQSYASERRVLRRYGRELAGLLPTLYLIQRSYAKSMVLRNLAWFGLHNRVLKKKYPLVTAEEKVQAERILQDVIKIRVPGWDD